MSNLIDEFDQNELELNLAVCIQRERNQLLVVRFTYFWQCYCTYRNYNSFKYMIHAIFIITTKMRQWLFLSEDYYPFCVVLQQYCDIRILDFD